MRDKSLKRKRMINYFVAAAASIIEEDGISGITIRKVADKTGYNSATLYNYFENLDQLICLSALKFMTPYTTGLLDSVQSSSNSLEKNLKVWELFCVHSFLNPQIYEAIFFAHFGKSNISEYLTQYYTLFPYDAPRGDATISNMLSTQNIYDRNRILLRECVEDGYFDEKDLYALDEMTILLYKGMLSKVLSETASFSPQEYTAKTMDYIRRCYKSFLLPEKASAL